MRKWVLVRMSSMVVKINIRSLLVSRPPSSRNLKSESDLVLAKWLITRKFSRLTNRGSKMKKLRRL